MFKLLLLVAVFTAPAAAGCSFTDLNCWKGVLDDASDKFRKEFDGLSDELKKGLSKAEDFAKLSGDQLKSISADLLADSKNVVGMTADQLKGLGSKIQDMTLNQSTSFFSKINKDALEGSIANLGAGGNWTFDHAKSLVDRLEGSDVWGDVTKWTKENFKKLGNITKGLNVEDLIRIGDDILSDVDVAKFLDSDQIGPLIRKVNRMATDKAKSFYNNIPVDELKKAIKNFGKMDTWDKAKLAKLMVRLKGVFGDLKDWSMDTWKELGDMAGPFAIENITAINTDAFKGYKDKIVKAISEADSFKNSAWADKQATFNDIINKIKESYGDAATWTKETVAALGPALISSDVLDKIPVQTLKDAIPDIINNDFDWKSMKQDAVDATKKFTTRLQKADAWGEIKTWGADKLNQLKDLLPVSIPSVDIPKLDKTAFSGAIDEIRRIADENGFNKDQIKGLADKAKEAYGEVKDWTADQVNKIGSIVSGVNAEDIKTLKDDTLAALKAAGVQLMDKLQLDSLGDRLKKLSESAKNSVYGDKLKELTKDAKKALSCKTDGTCKKFVDFVIKVKDLSADKLATLYKKLKEFITKHTSITDLQDLTGATLDDIKDVAVRIFGDLPDDIKTKLDGAVKAIELTSDDLVLENTPVLSTAAYSVDPDTGATTDPASSVAMAVPSFMAVLGSIALLM